jgi:hypothetical protein
MADIQVQTTVTVALNLPQDEAVWNAQALAYWVQQRGAPTADAAAFAQSTAERLLGSLVTNRAA